MPPREAILVLNGKITVWCTADETSKARDPVAINSAQTYINHKPQQQHKQQQQ
jgi:hypothetical protein